MQRRLSTERTVVAAGNVRIDLRIDGDGPAVVLLPSSLRDSLDFDPVATRIAAAGFRVLRPQPRGTAGTEGPLPRSLSDLAGDVVATIEQAGDGRAVIAGHAFGHFVARVAALEHTARVRGVAILAGAARTFPPGMAETLEAASDASLPEPERLAQLRRGFFAPGNDPAPWLHGWYPQLRAAYRAASASPPKDAWWPVSPVPLLDLQAEADPWRPPDTRDELRRAIGAGVTIRVVPACSHAMLPERPDAVAAALVDWMRGLPA